MEHADERVPSGVPGFDEVLGGGYPAGRIMLIEGAPGTGKTTLALQFLQAVAGPAAPGLFLSIAQSRDELEMIAASHGLALTHVTVHSPELSEVGRSVSVDTDEALLETLLDQIARKIEELKPRFFVFDSLLEVRLLSPSQVAYRRELLALRLRLRRAGVTALLLDHLGDEIGERHAEAIVHGVVRLDAETPPIGITHRRLHVLKLRGSSFREGFHDLRIRRGGVTVFPRVTPSDTAAEPPRGPLSPDRPALAETLGGGLEFGTTALITGQSGVGKSTLSTVFAVAAAKQRVKSALYLFEERPEVFRARSAGVGLALEGHEASGLLSLQHFDPAEASPGEFSRIVIRGVEEDGVRLVVIDSLTGFLSSLPERRNVVTHLASLLKYLSRRGVLSIVASAQHGLLGEPPRTDLDASYLADSIILLRQYAAQSEIRRSIAVLKKRHGPHDRGIRELVIRDGAVEVRPLSDETAARAAGSASLGGA